MMPLTFAVAAIVVQGQLDFDFRLAVLGDGQERVSAVECFQGVEYCIFLNFAALDLPLSPPSLPLTVD